jgi:phosphoglycerol transferase MdoB-like AlkP superfamily enzyme
LLSRKLSLLVLKSKLSPYVKIALKLYISRKELFLKMSKFNQSLTLFLFALLIMSLQRVILYFLNLEEFQELNEFDTFLAFINGVRIDLITLLTFTGVLFLYLTYIEYWRKFVGVIWLLIFLIIFTINFGDTIYFPFVHRHISNEIYLIGNDLEFILDIGEEYILEVMIYLFSLIIISYLWFKILRIKIGRRDIALLKRILLSTLLLSLIFIGIRSKFDGKPFGISDAFIDGKVEIANLSLNGFFSIYRSSKREGFKYMESNEALKISKELISSKDTEFVNSEFPFQRRFIDLKDDRPNVVILFIESLTSKYVDSFGDGNFSVTPFLDKLAKDGVSFKNFYANGQRSIEGVTSLLTGFPSISGIPNLGYGLELSNFSYLGDLAYKNGYRTLGMQSSKRSSFRIDQLFQLAGFHEFYGSEDMRDCIDFERDIELPFGAVWDGNSLRFLSEKLKDENRPFLSLLFTASTHFPYRLPSDNFERYPHSDTGLNGYLNSLNYLDSELEKFFKRSEKEKWFENTIFIVTGDHTIGKGVNFKRESFEHFQIPLIIYSPKYLKSEIRDEVSSQIDILPTVMDLANLQSNFSSFGNSLFGDRAEFAILKEGTRMIFKDRDSYKNLENSVELKSLLQTFSELLERNRILSINND